MFKEDQEAFLLVKCFLNKMGQKELFDLSVKCKQ